MIKTNAEAIICGETYDVNIVDYPDKTGLCKVDVPFEDGAFVETIAVSKENIWPKNEKAIAFLMGAN